METGIAAGDRQRDLTPVYTESQLRDILKIADQDSNDYSTKKSIGQHHLNLSSIMYLISLFLAVFSDGVNPATGRYNPAQIALIVLICVSISLQFVIFVLITILANSKTENLSTSPRCTCTATGVNNLVTSLTGLLLIVTTAITSVSTYARIQGTFPVNSTAL